MGSFGLFFYGPYQHYWYRTLDRAMPVRSIPNFLAKVSLNQLCLAPIVIAGVFAWNLALQNKIEELPNKVRHHFVPTLLDGWKFWIPAASVNFVAVPLQHQVLYMSLCGVVWTGYLSYSSANATQKEQVGKGKGKKK
jgi:protein Mpv17